MFKKLRNAIARRRDMRLRKWCVKHTTDNKALTASDLYNFITGSDWIQKGQESRKRIKEECQVHVADLDGTVRV